jgi:hypothetical protein
MLDKMQVGSCIHVCGNTAIKGQEVGNFLTWAGWGRLSTAALSRAMPRDPRASALCPGSRKAASMFSRCVLAGRGRQSRSDTTLYNYFISDSPNKMYRVRDNDFNAYGYLAPAVPMQVTHHAQSTCCDKWRGRFDAPGGAGPARCRPGRRAGPRPTAAASARGPPPRAPATPRPADPPRPAPPRREVDVKFILTPPCIVCMKSIESH